MEGVYILHFSEALGHARHYVGYSPNVPARIEKHIKGQGSAITKHLHKMGIDFEVAYVWQGAGRAFEKSIKHRRGSITQYCPICQAMGS
jgi:predicted GIY-YIG superfamily endonuclease